MQQSDLQLWSAWQGAAKRDEIDQAIRDLYSDIADEVAERRPVCNASGRCCKFETYGHRLYVTGLEIAWFLNQLTSADLAQTSEDSSKQIRLPQLSTAPSEDACLYQIDGLCSTHAMRPLGCRVYFCEEGTEAWQQDTTEHFLDQLKQLHAEHGLPYSYMEWRAGLAEAHQFLDASI